MVIHFHKYGEPEEVFSFESLIIYVMKCEKCGKVITRIRENLDVVFLED